MAPPVKIELTLRLLLTEDSGSYDAVGIGNVPVTGERCTPLALYQYLIAGYPLPSELVARPGSLATLVAVTVFMSRHVALLPSVLPTLAAAEMVDDMGVAGLAHIDRDLARLFMFLQDLLGQGRDVTAQGHLWGQGMKHVEAWLDENRLPALPPEPPAPRVLEKGTNGFVVAETPATTGLEQTWIELYRQGHLRGVLFGGDLEGRCPVVIARKSAFLQFDLGRAATVLNEAEQAGGGAPTWVADTRWLRSPGTALLRSQVLDVALRV